MAKQNMSELGFENESKPESSSHKNGTLHGDFSTSSPIDIKKKGS